MDLLEHKKNFEQIVKKYNLKNEKKAEEISNFLISTKKISYKKFATLFNLNEEDAKIFLLFVLKGIKFKENYID